MSPKPAFFAAIAACAASYPAAHAEEQKFNVRISKGSPATVFAGAGVADPPTLEVCNVSRTETPVRATLSENGKGSVSSGVDLARGECSYVSANGYVRLVLLEDAPDNAEAVARVTYIPD